MISLFLEIRIKISSSTTGPTVFAYAHENETKRSTTIMKNVFALQQIRAAGIQNSTDVGYYGYCQ
jgi:hypothetical protein